MCCSLVLTGMYPAVLCYGGLTAIKQEAVKLNGRSNLELEEVTIGITGKVL